MTTATGTLAPREGDRVRLTYGDGSFVEGTWRAVLELDDGRLHTHTRGQVRRDVVVQGPDWCTCGEAWQGHPEPHALTCPLAGSAP
jgi:hypothetical protein